MPDRKTLRVDAGTDFAITSKGGHFTVFVVVGMDPARRLYLLDLYRKQVSTSRATPRPSGAWSICNGSATSRFVSLPRRAGFLTAK